MNRFIDSSELFSSAGSFWYEHIDKSQRAFLEALMNVCDMPSSFSAIDKLLTNLSGSNEYIRNDFLIDIPKDRIFPAGSYSEKRYTTIPLLELNVRTAIDPVTGNKIIRYDSGSSSVRITEENKLSELNSMLDSDTDIFSATKHSRHYDPLDVEAGNIESIYFSYDNESKTNNSFVGFAAEKLYGVAIPANVFPIHLLSVRGDLLLNVHYYHNNNALFFKRHPYYLFPEKRLYVKSARVYEKGIFDKIIKTGVSKGTTKNVFSFSRGGFSPDKLVLSILDKYAIPYLKSRDLLRSINEYPDKVEYVFDKQALTINYPHKKLVIGDTYENGFAVGEPIKWLLADKNNYYWYRKNLRITDIEINSHEKIIYKFPDTDVLCVLRGEDEIPFCTQVPSRNEISDIYDPPVTGDNIIYRRENGKLMFRVESDNFEYINNSLLCGSKLIVDGVLNIASITPDNKIIKDITPINKKYEEVFDGETYEVAGPVKLCKLLRINKNSVFKVNRYSGRHIRMENPQESNSDNMDMWKRIVPKNEFVTGRYLNEKIRLNNRKKTTYINPFDVFIQEALGNEGLIFIVNRTVLGRHKEVKQILNENSYGGKKTIIATVEDVALKSGDENYFSINKDNSLIFTDKTYT